MGIGQKSLSFKKENSKFLVIFSNNLILFAIIMCIIHYRVFMCNHWPKYSVLGTKYPNIPHFYWINSLLILFLAKHYVKYKVNMMAIPMYISSQKIRLTDDFLKLAWIKRTPIIFINITWTSKQDEQNWIKETNCVINNELMNNSWDNKGGELRNNPHLLKSGIESIEV